MTGIGMCCVLIFVTAITSQNNVVVFSLLTANGFYGFCVMSCFGVCADIGRNNAGTVTGAMNFFGQTGAFFLAIVFGKIAQVMHNFDYPLIVVAAVLCISFLLWLIIDPLKQLTIPMKEREMETELV